MANPWDNDPIVGAPDATGIGRPVIRRGADPSKPEFIPGSPGQVYDPKTGGAVDIPGFKPKVGADKTTFRTLSSKEVTDLGLPPGAYQMGSDGKVDKIGDLPKVEPDIAQQIKGLGIDEWLTNVNRAREQIKTGFATGVLGSIAGHFPGTPRADFLGSLEGIKGASILEKLQALREQSKNGSSGMGSLTEQEGERLANSIASLNPDMSAKELNKSLDIIEHHARALQAIGAGMNPDDPAAPAPPALEGDKAPLVNPIAGGFDGDQGPSLTPSGGETRSVIDPKKQALAAKIGALVTKGADRNTIMGFAVGADPTLRGDPVFRGWVNEALQYRVQHPGARFPIDPGFYTTEIPLSAPEKVGNAAAQSGPGAAVMSAADAVTAGNLGNISGDQEGVNRALAVAAGQHPGFSLGGTMAGGATAAMGLESLLGIGGMASGALRTGIADVGYGGTAGASNAPEGAGISGGTKGALAALLGGIAGKQITRGAGALASGVTNPTVGYVAKEVPLTLGQALSQSGTVGKMVKGIEDRLSGIPIVGDAINARRLEGMQRMNAKAFDRALEPVKETVSGKFGEEAVADAQDKVSQAFGKALAGKSAGLDRGFVADATKAKMGVDKLPDRVRGEVNNSIDETINNYFDHGGQISGENMQTLLRELGQIKRSYKNDPLGHRVGKVVDQFSDSVENLFRRQAPEVMPQYDAAKTAFRRVSILEDAVNKGKNTGGIFTPAQLGMVDRVNTVKFNGKGAAAAGKSPFQEFQRNMQEVLPSKVPDSGTAGRLLIPGALIAGGAGAGAAGGDAEKGLTLGALLAMAYSRTGQRALSGAVLKRVAGARAIGEKVRNAAPLLGHGAGAVASLGATRE